MPARSLAMNPLKVAARPPWYGRNFGTKRISPLYYRPPDVLPAKTVPDRNSNLHTRWCASRFCQERR